MEYKTIEEWCDILDSQRIPVTSSDRKKGTYPYYGANGIQYYVDSYIFDDELVLLAEDGGNFGSKDRPIAYRVSGKCWVNNHAHVLKPKEGLNVDYLCHSLMFYNTNGIVNGATRQKLTQASMRQMKIPFRPLNEQNEIIEKIAKIESVIALKKQELDLLDELVKSRFIELFGDLKINPFGWDEINISDVVDGKVSNGFFSKRDDYCKDGNVNVLGVANVVNRMYSNCENLPRTNATEKDIEKFALRYGDLLFCRSSLVAEGIGKASVVPENVSENTLFECHVIRLPLDLKKIIPEYIQALTTTDYFRKQVLSSAKTATMTTIGQDGILKCNIMLPPYEKQKEFLEFIKKVDKSKSVCQLKINLYQELLDKKMDEYFNLKEE